MATPRPTPTALRILKGDTSKGKTPIPTNEPAVRCCIPPMPDLRDEVARDEWDRLSQVLLETGVLSNLDAQTLALYCDTYSVYIQARDDVTSRGFEVPSSVRLDGSVALTCKNPAIAVMESARRDLLKHLVEFGATPSARTRVLGLNPGGKSDELADFAKRKKRG